MTELVQYALSIISAGIIVGIVSGITPSKGAAGSMVRMICGLFLTFTAITPLRKLDFDAVTVFTQKYLESGYQVADQGEELACNAVGEIIKEETEAYILDIATAYQADILPEVKLSTDSIPVPVGVLLKGRITPYGKQQLQQILEKELGIPKENQQWIS